MTTEDSPQTVPIWKVFYYLPGDRDGDHFDDPKRIRYRRYGFTTSERIAKECEDIKDWTTEKLPDCDDWSLPRITPQDPKEWYDRDFFHARRWCSWWINDQTLDLATCGTKGKHNVHAGLYCALPYFQAKSALEALKCDAQTSDAYPDILRCHQKRLDEALNRFEWLEKFAVQADIYSLFDKGRDKEIGEKNMDTLKSKLKEFKMDEYKDEFEASNCKALVS